MDNLKVFWLNVNIYMLVRVIYIYFFKVVYINLYKICLEKRFFFGELCIKN